MQATRLPLQYQLLPSRAHRDRNGYYHHLQCRLFGHKSLPKMNYGRGRGVGRDLGVGVTLEGGVGLGATGTMAYA